MEDFSYLFSLYYNPEASIAETWTNQGWNIIFRRLLNDWEIESVASLLQRLYDFSSLNSSPDSSVVKSALQSEATHVRFFILRRGDLKKALASDEEARSDPKAKAQ